MPELTVSDSVRTITIESSAYMDATGPIVRGLVDLLIKFEGTVEGLVLLKFKKQPSGLYTYEFTATSEGGRSWEQSIEIPESGPARMDFDVPDRWTVQEFAPHRDIRAKCIDLATSLGVTLVKVEWA